MFVSQHQYDGDLLRCAGMAECHSTSLSSILCWIDLIWHMWYRRFVTSSMIAASLTSRWSSTFCATWRACSLLSFTSIAVLLAPYSTSSVPVLTLRYSLLHGILVVLCSSLLFAHPCLCYLIHLQICVGLRSFCPEPHRSKIEIVWTQPQS